MKSIRLHAELLVHRYGWLPALTLLLTLIGGWLYFVATPQVQVQVREYHNALTALATEAKQTGSESESATPLIQKRHAAFHAHLATKESIPSIVRILFSKAQKASLVLQRMDYKLTREVDGAYLVYRIDVPIKGPYPNIYQFADEVLVNIPSAALEEISFLRETAGSATTDAKLRFAVYLEGTR